MTFGRVWENIGVRGYLFGPVTVANRPVIDQCCDFIVTEDIDVIQGNRYPLYMLIKENIDTLNAVREVKIKLGCKRVGYSGLKDKASLSVQYITLDSCEVYPSIELFRFGLIKRLGALNVMLTKGRHCWNYFTVKMRHLDNDSISTFIKNLSRAVFPNFVGYQRFGLASPFTHELGLAYLRYIQGDENDFLRLIGSKKGWWEREFIDTRKLNPAVEKLLVQSVQSYFFNYCLSLILNELKKGKGPLLFKAGVLAGYDLKSMHLPSWVSREHYECVKGLIDEYVLPLHSLRQLQIRTRLRPLTESVDIVNKHVGPGYIVMRFKLSPGAYATAFIRELAGDIGSVFSECKRCLNYYRLYSNFI